MIRTKAFLIVVCVGLLQCNRGIAVQFEFAPDGIPCILLDIEEATFNLTNGDEAASLFQIKSDTNVSLSESRCEPDKSSNILTLKLDTGESLKFKFSLNGENVVMETTLAVDPSRHFENDTTPMFELQTGEKLLLGPQDKSFQCSGEDLVFAQDLPYYMTLEIRGLHVQAYDVTDTYSPAEICSADITTPTPTGNTPKTTKLASATTYPTSGTTNPSFQTTKLTSETTGPATKTTPKTKSTPSTVPTTVFTFRTTTSPPKVPKYALSNGTGTFCVVLQGYFTFHIPYNSSVRNETELKNTNITIPGNASIGGYCSLGEFTQEMTLTFFKNWTFSVIFKRQPVIMTRRRLLAKSETYTWKEFSLTYVYDENFEEPADAGTKTVTNAPERGAFQGQGEAGFKCNAVEKQELTGSGEAVQMDISDLRYRAFGDTKDDTLGNTGCNNFVVLICDAECPQDKTDGDGDDLNVGAIVGGIVGGVVFIIIITIILIGVTMHCRRKRRRNYFAM